MFHLYNRILSGKDSIVKNFELMPAKAGREV